MTPDELKRLQERMTGRRGIRGHERGLVVTGGGNVNVSGTPGEIRITDTKPDPVWARITAAAGGTTGRAYAWTEVLQTDDDFPDYDTTYFRKSGTATSWPAFDVNGSPDVPVGTKVQLWPDPSGTHWVFEVGGEDCCQLFSRGITAPSGILGPQAPYQHFYLTYGFATPSAGINDGFILNFNGPPGPLGLTNLGAAGPALQHQFEIPGLAIPVPRGAAAAPAYHLETSLYGELRGAGDTLGGTARMFLGARVFVDYQPNGTGPHYFFWCSPAFILCSSIGGNSTSRLFNSGSVSHRCMIHPSQFASDPNATIRVYGFFFVYDVGGAGTWSGHVAFPSAPGGGLSYTRLERACCTPSLTTLIGSCIGSPPPGTYTAPVTINFAVTVTGGVAPYTFLWTFGDGDTSTAQSPSHVYDDPGVYTPQVTVTDSLGTTATCQPGTWVIEGEVIIINGMVMNGGLMG